MRPARLAVCDRLTDDEFEPAVLALRHNPVYTASATGVDGFRPLFDRQAERNRYLYRIPDPDGEPQLLALSERFCPLANRPYAGLTLYHPNLKRNLSSHIHDLRDAAQHLLPGGTGANPPAPARLRMLIEERDPFQREIQEQFREWDSVTAVERSVVDFRVTDRQAAEWQRCVRRPTSSLPVWRDGPLTVRVCRPDEAWDVFQMQRTVHRNLRNLAPCDVTAHDRLRRGIEQTAAAHAAEGFAAALRHGAFLVCYDRTRLIGCAWCYRSFTPHFDRWTVWLRWLYLTPSARGGGAVAALLGGGVGLFTEPGRPVLIRRLVPPDCPTRPAQFLRADFYEF